MFAPNEATITYGAPITTQSLQCVKEPHGNI